MRLSVHALSYLAQNLRSASASKAPIHVALLASLAAASALACLGAARADAETYTVENWPGDIDTIPCSAWTHYPDGTWELKGYVKLGASVIENIGFKGDSSARLLDQKCGKK